MSEGSPVEAPPVPSLFVSFGYYARPDRPTPNLPLVFVGIGNAAVEASAPRTPAEVKALENKLRDGSDYPRLAYIRIINWQVLDG